MSVSSQDKQRVKPQEKRKEGGAAETGRVIFHALIIAFVIRTFLFQPFNIPSGSMMATLLVGDYLFVSKYSYGYSHYSLPLSPRLFSGRIFGSEPQRGDVVVFRLPKDDSTDYIKRVIGLPGDRIQMIDGVLNINEQPVKRERIDDFIDEDGGRTVRVKRWRETLPNGVSYNTLDLQDNGFLDNTQVYTVPAGHYLHDGRQPRQLDRQPRAEPGRLRAVREPGRPGADHLLLGRRRRAGLAFLELAVVGALEPAVHDRAMSRRTKGTQASSKSGSATASPTTHCSTARSPIVSALSGKSRASSYQRLEFLGDHVLGLVVSDMLFRAFPKADEGELSRRLADLVRKETCAEVARAIDLGAVIKLGTSEANTGGRRRLAILADVCEALVGAVFLDGGYPAAAALIERLWGERMRAPARRCAIPRPCCRNGRRRAGCRRRSTARSSAPGRTTIPSSASRSCCRTLQPAEGVGRSKRAAEQAAAAALLTREGVEAAASDG